MLLAVSVKPLVEIYIVARYVIPTVGLQILETAEFDLYRSQW